MSQLTITVPDELLPAITAEFLAIKTGNGTEAASPEEYFQESVVEIIRQRAELLKVGPYFKGAVEPRFLADGTPNPEYDGPDKVNPLPEPKELIDEEDEANNVIEEE